MMSLRSFAPPVAAVLVICGLASPVSAEPDLDDLAGSVVARVGGKELHLPLLKADYTVRIDGDAAHVKLTQTFLNPTRTPLHATYLFPLNQKAAVHAMRMDLDGESVVAKIRKKDEARETFEKAKAEGKAAALLTQHRPNMFTQDIAHLMPGRPVRITLEYVQHVPKIDGTYELVVPMVVGPRYESPGPDVSVVLSGSKNSARLPGDDNGPVPAAPVETVSGWQIDKLPAYPAVLGQDAPDDIDPKRVTFDLHLAAPMPVNALWSDTHALDVTDIGRTKQVRLAGGKAIDNRDLVLRYKLAAEHTVAAGVSSVFDADRGGYFSLLIEPPQLPAEDSIGRRELVFVLDTSGSMSGEPIEASKAFMEAAIKGLRPDDYFRILRFSNETSQFATHAVKATTANRQKALGFVSGLAAGGGTEINKAINAAFDLEQPPETSRIVVFLTDGYIGGERAVISTIASRIGEARIYAFGVGDAVNRFLLDAMAEEGRGYARYVGLGEEARTAAEALAASLKTPLLTDISVDWNGLDVKDQVPARIPDLFEGGSVRVLGRYETGGKHTIFVDGLVNGRAARLPVEIDLEARETPDAAAAGALPLLWARERIFQKNRAYTIGGSRDRQLERDITDLGLTYSLQSRFTSFVAVSEKVVNEAPETATSRNVPLPQVSGVSTQAYPSLNLSGSSAPEPEGVLGVMMILLALAARFRRQLRAQAGRLAGKGRTGRHKGLDRALPRTLRRDGWWLES
jgi:Ca-activated chloride channel family protein